MRDFLLKIHHIIVDYIASLWITEHLLIAKVQEDGESYDCIYCTILRNLFIGFIFGLVMGYLVWKF